jgi:hypothetical protein
LENNMNTVGVLPTVITTNCELRDIQTSNPHSSHYMELRNNLAIFDSSGFYFSAASAIFSNGTSWQFYAIVPSVATTITTPSAASSAPTYSTAAATMTEAPMVSYPSTTTFPTNMDTCAVNSITGGSTTSVTDGPDITIDSGLTDTGAATPDFIQDFFYTPATICRYNDSGTVLTSGKLYAGYRVDLTLGTGSFTDVLTNNTANLNPWTPTGLGTPTVTYIAKVSGS